MINMTTDNLLSSVDRWSHQLGPVSRLLTHLVDRIVPSAVAKAETCPPPNAYEICSEECRWTVTCCPGPANFGLEEIIVYGYTIMGCSGPKAECSKGCQPERCGSC